MSRNIARFFHFSIESEFNALRFINYTIPRLCSTNAVATIVANQLPSSHWRFSKNLSNSWCFLFDSHKIGPRVIFHQFSDTSPKLFWQLNGGLLFVRTSFHSVRTAELPSEYFAVWTSQLVNKSTDRVTQLLNRYYYMATHPALLSPNLIGWLSGREAASLWIQLLNKNWKRTLIKVVSKFS